MKKRTAGLLLGAVVCTMLLSGCGETEETMKETTTEEQTETTEPEVTPEPVIELVKVGVLFPEGAEWNREQETLGTALTEAGYEGVLMTADTGEVQAGQILEAMEAGAEALIVSPVDGYALEEAMAAAEEKSIPVISYDNMILKTAALDYHVTFDMRAAGREAGANIVKKENLQKARENKKTCTIEFLMGSPDDSGALFFFNGMMEVLQEYFDDGTLVCKSGRVSFDDNGVLRWSETSAKDTMNRVFAEFYAEEGAPDIIAAGSDRFIYGILEILEEKEILPDSEQWPFITGLGGEAEAVKNVAEGKVAFTMFENRRDLAEACVEIVSTCLSGEKFEAKDYAQYDNGKKIIGTETCNLQVIDKDNYQVLIDNGTYTMLQIEPDRAVPAPHTTL